MLRFSLFLALSCLFIFLSLHVKEKDYLFYERYIIKTKEPDQTDMHQIRQKIQKDIWFCHNQVRKQCRIFSDTSHFTFSRKRKKADELLYHISGWVQEEVFENKQKLRYFTSQEGIYSFMPHTFLSKKANISFLEESGTEIPSTFHKEKAYMHARADQILFDLNENKPFFSAKHLKAIFPNVKKEHVQSKQPH